MESGSIIQFLIVVAVVIYGVWNASQKAAKLKREQEERGAGSGVDSSDGQEMSLEDYLMSSMKSMSKKSELSEEEVDVRRVGKGSRTKSKSGDNYHMATSSIDSMSDSTENVDEVNVYGDKQEVASVEVITDLRTIIISSELLKPKYLEY